MIDTLLIHLAYTTPPLGTDSGNEALLIWVFGLFAIALGLVVLEIFIPSGGVIGIAALLCSIAAVGLAFRIGIGYGLSAAGFWVLATPSSVWVALKVFPNTPVGKRIILTDGTTSDDIQKRDVERQFENRSIASLVGMTGEAITDLRPGGTIRIEGQDVEAFAESGYIEVGETVEIVSTNGRQLKVRTP